MDNPWVAPLAGLVLLVVGGLLLRWNFREWNAEKNDSSLDDLDRHHYYSRFRRRVQTSSLLLVLGVIIPVGDWLMGVLKDNPMFATIFVLLVLAIVGWMILLALGDMAATRAHSRVSLSRVRREQRELEQKLVELRNRKSNGHASQN